MIRSDDEEALTAVQEVRSVGGPPDSGSGLGREATESSFSAEGVSNALVVPLSSDSGVV